MDKNGGVAPGEAVPMGINEVSAGFLLSLCVKKKEEKEEVGSRQLL